MLDFEHVRPSLVWSCLQTKKWAQNENKNKDNTTSNYLFQQKQILSEFVIDTYKNRIYFFQSKTDGWKIHLDRK